MKRVLKHLLVYYDIGYSVYYEHVVMRVSVTYYLLKKTFNRILFICTNKYIPTYKTFSISYCRLGKCFYCFR